jgi:transcriptional regulator with XRE-family HTH domain
MTQKLLARTLGGRLRELREQQGWNCTETAEKLGILPRTYNKYEHDVIQNPSRMVLQKFVALFHVPLDVLCRRDNSFSHLPPKILEMIQQPDIVPFLLNTYKEYQRYLADKETTDD